MLERLKGKVMSIYLGEADKHGHKPLYRELVETLHRLGVRGATVTRGIEGYGRAGHIHLASVLRLSEDLPVVVQVLESEEKIKEILPVVEGLLQDGVIAIQDAELVFVSQDG